MVACLGNLTIETAGTEEEAEEGMAAAIRMEVEADMGREGEEGVEGLNKNWKPLSSSLRNLSRAELRSLMPAMASTS